MHRRRSRSPLHISSPMANQLQLERPVETFSISSLSDCSIGKDGREARGRQMSNIKSKRRHSRSDEKHFDNREKRHKIPSRERSERHRDNFLQFEPNTNNSFVNRRDSERERDPSICFGDAPMSQSEASYIRQRSPVLSTDGDRLGRLEKMVEMLVQNNMNKQPPLHFVPAQETRSSTSVEGVHKGPQFLTSVWLNKINEECLERQFDEMTCINFMQSKMTGLMKAWFKTIDIYQYTWPEIKMIIIKSFPDTDDFAGTLRLLVDRTKRSDETVAQYYFAKMFLIEACKISGPNAVSCLIDGLYDSHLQKEARKFNFVSPETFFTQFLSKLPNFSISNQIIEEEPIIEIVRDHGIREREREEYFQHENFKKREVVFDDSKKKCYTCGKYGHISENCRHAPICYKCRQKGHIAVKCPN